MKARFPSLLPVVLGLLVLIAGARAAEEISKDQQAGAAAARADAFINLTNDFYVLGAREGRTVGGLLARNADLRAELEAALRSAAVVDGPTFGETGLAHVAVELETSLLSYDLRSKISVLPRYIRADGVADIKSAFMLTGAVAAGVSDEVTQWAEKPLEAEGEAKVPAGKDAEKAKAAARFRAIANAHAALSKDILELSLDPDVTVAAFLTRHPELRIQVNAAMVWATLTSESIDAEGEVYKVKLSLPGTVLLPPLRLGRFRGDLGRALTPEMAEFARINGFVHARANLKRRIYAMQLRSGAPAKTLIEREEAAKKRIDRLCRTRAILRFEVTPTGVGKVRVGLATRDLPSALRDLLVEGTPRRLYAIGGGMPVRPPKPVEEKPDDKKGDAKKGAPPAPKKAVDKPPAKGAAPAAKKGAE